MAARVRSFHWASTPLGARDRWPAALSAVVDLMLATPQMATLAVGPERIFLYNDETAGHYGARHPAALGRPLAETFPGEYQRVAGFYDRVFAGESVHVPAQPLDLMRTGAPEVFDAYLTPVRDNGGDVIAVPMTGNAVAPRMRAEAALRESEARLSETEEQYRTLFEAVKRGVRVIERIPPDAFGRVDFRYVAANAAFEELTGLRDVIGRTQREVVPGIEQHIVDSYDAVARTGEPWRFETHVAELDRWFEGEAVRADPPPAGLASLARVWSPTPGSVPPTIQRGHQPNVG